MESITPGTENQAPPDPRQRYIDGLRVLASVLENNPEIPLPWAGRGVSYVTMMFHGDDARTEMAAAARAFPCSWDKRFSGEGGQFFDLLGIIGDLKVELTAPRDAVCTRRVVGTEEREVEEVVTPAVTKKVAKPVEVIEWDCGSLLAPRPAVAGEDPKADYIAGRIAAIGEAAAEVLAASKPSAA